MRHIIGPAAPLARSHETSGASAAPPRSPLRTTLFTSSRRRRQATTTSASAAERLVPAKQMEKESYPPSLEGPLHMG